MSSEGLARGAGELSCAELDSTVSSPPSGSGFSIFGAAGSADVPSFLLKVVTGNPIAIFSRLTVSGSMCRRLAMRVWRRNCMVKIFHHA